MLLARIKQEKKRKKISRKKRKIEWPFNQKKLSKWRARVRHSWRNNTQYPGGEGERERRGFVFQEGIKRDFSVLWKRKKKKKKNEDRSKGAEIEQKLDNIRAYTRRGQAIDSVSRGSTAPPLPCPPPSWLINFHVRSFRVELPNVISPGARFILAA